MKFNPIISEIIRGQWLFDTTNIEGYYTLVDNLLQGKKFEFNSNYNQEVKGIQIFDRTGKFIRSTAENPAEIPQGAIAQVEMIGEIVKYGDWCVAGADEIVAELYQAQSLKNVDATIFKIDGPGGSVKAIGPFKEFAKNKTKPVIGLVDDALSLHYWAACEVCDYIIADNDVSARFGSVGVVSCFRDNQEAMKKLGFKDHEIYPQESEHKNLAFTLAREGKYDMIKAEHLSPLAQKFQAGVKANRPNLKEEVGVLTGKTFYADEALRLGMIDAIGGMDLALEMAQRFANQYKIKSLI